MNIKERLRDDGNSYACPHANRMPTAFQPHANRMPMIPEKGSGS